MSYVYHVITPLGRLQNLERLIRMLEPMQQVRWHVIFDEGLPFDVSFSGHTQRWITKGYCPRSSPFWSFWADAQNRFISAGPLVDDDRYCILNDDDAYEPGFFDKLDRHTGEVIVCSMKRGQHIPAGVAADRAHGTDTLEAKPESMGVGRVGAEQMITSGRVWAKYGFTNTITADGERIVKVVAENEVNYVPDAYVLFNRFENGRWDD